MANKAITLLKMTRLNKLIEERKAVNKEMDQLIVSGARIGLNDPLSIKEDRLSKEIFKLKKELNIGKR